MLTAVNFDIPLTHLYARLYTFITGTYTFPEYLEVY